MNKYQKALKYIYEYLEDDINDDLINVDYLKALQELADGFEGVESSNLPKIQGLMRSLEDLKDFISTIQSRNAKNLEVGIVIYAEGYDIKRIIFPYESLVAQNVVQEIENAAITEKEHLKELGIRFEDWIYGDNRERTERRSV